MKLQTILLAGANLFGIPPTAPVRMFLKARSAKVNIINVLVRFLMVRLILLPSSLKLVLPVKQLMPQPNILLPVSAPLIVTLVKVIGISRLSASYISFIRSNRPLIQLYPAYLPRLSTQQVHSINIGRRPSSIITILGSW